MNKRSFVKTFSWLYSGKLLKFLIIFCISFLLILLGIILVPEPYYKEGFRNLKELEEYAKTIDEFAQMDRENFFYPSYELYYQENYTKTLATRVTQKINALLILLRLKKPPIFSETFFKTILNKVLNDRTKKHWIGDFAQKIELNLNSKLVVFGAVQGAFHALVRYLKELQSLEIIDNNLKITSPNFYITFLGNVINRCPYTLEMLSIILRLLENNPENIFYLKSTAELPNEWKEQSLKRELEIRAKTLSSSEIPLQNEIDQFLQTLPLTLYCILPTVETDSTEVPYFKLLGYLENTVYSSIPHESKLISFLSKKSNHLDTVNLIKQSTMPSPGNRTIKLKAIVRDIKKRTEYEEMDGLLLLHPTKGITTWTVLSTSAETYRLAINFFYDAFAIITPAERSSDSLITLYNRDTRNANDKTFKSKSFNFFTGNPIDNQLEKI